MIGDRKGQQAAPVVNAHDVSRIVERDFSPGTRNQVFAILEEFENSQDGDADRVRLAALKLACGDLDRLITHIAAATRDWRDVVAAAEYPAYIQERSPAGLSLEKRQRLIDADWNQYHEWLGR
jgi:hypothetical protein